MERLRCGTILLDRFLQFLSDEACRLRSEGKTHPVAILEYIQCAEGRRAGQAFWSLMWGSGQRDLQDWCLFEAGGVPIYMSRQTQLALQWKYIDFIDNKVVVLP